MSPRLKTILVVVLTAFVFAVVVLAASRSGAVRNFRASEIQALSKVRTSAVQVRLGLLGLFELDPTSVTFPEEKGDTVTRIKQANQALKDDLASYDEARKGAKKFSLGYLARVWFETVNSVARTNRRLSRASAEIDTYLTQLETVESELQEIYTIFLPSDYQNYSSEYEQVEDIELANEYVFSDVAARMEQVDIPGVDLRGLISQLEELQSAFEECLAMFPEDVIVYADLADCEENLAVDDLKKTAYDVELSGISSDDFLKVLVDLTNGAYALDSMVSKLSARPPNFFGNHWPSDAVLSCVVSAPDEVVSWVSSSSSSF